MKKIYKELFNRISIYYNPVVLLHNGVISGFEKGSCWRKLIGVRFSLVMIFSFFCVVSKGQNNLVAGISLPATQTGSITYGTVSNATYLVALTTDGGPSDGTSDLSLAWTGPAPSGVIVGFSPVSPLTLPGGSTSQNVTLTITSATTTDAGTYDFTISATNDPQTSLTASFIVTTATTTTAITSDNDPACFGSPVTLTSTVTPNTATGTVEFFDGATSLGTNPVSGGVATLTTSSLPVGPRSLTAAYSGDLNYDAGTSPVLTQTVNAVPVAPTGSVAQSFCAINNPTVAGLAATGTGIQWYAVANGGSALATSTPLVNGDHYYASQTISGCESFTRLDVTATVDDPAPPGGAAAQTFCAINNPTIADLAVTGNGIQWYASTVGGAPMASATLLATSHYFASQTVSGCESDTRFDVLATVDDPAAPTGSAAQSFCAISGPTVASLTATGTGIQWYAASSGGTALASSTALANGTHYYSSQTVSGCEGITRLDVTVTVDNPAAPTGSAAQSFCAISSPTVASLAATGTGIQWYAASSGGTALVTSTALVNGTHYYASQTVSGCESDTRFDVLATVDDPAAPTGSAAPSFCAISGPTVASLTATGTGIQWYAASSGGTALASSTALVNGTHYFASQTISGCESDTRLDVLATVDDPAAPTGSAAPSFCAINNPTVASLTATGTGIQWYAASSGGTALVTSTALVNGTHYYASQTVSGCESDTRFDVLATVDDPAAPTGSAAPSFCAISGPTIASLAATGTGIQWYVASSGGAALATSTALVNGTHYYASQTVSGCEGITRLDVTVTVNNPAAPTGSAAQSFCAISGPTIASLTATGTGIEWYAVSSGGAALATSTALVNGTHYYASQTVSGCEGTNRLNVTVTLNPAPIAGAITGPAAVCISSTISLTSNATGAATLTYTWSSSNTTVATVTNAGVVLGKATGTTNISYVVTDGNGCSSTSPNYVVTVTKPTASAITQATGISSVCVAGSLNLTSNATGTAPLTYTWASSDNTKATVNNSGVVTGVAAGTAGITYTVTDGNGCTNTSPTYNVTINPLPAGMLTASETSGLLNNDNIICAGAPVTFTAPAGFGSYIFRINNSATPVQSGTGRTYNTSSLNNGDVVTVDVANASNCGATLNPVTIMVNPLPMPTLVADKNPVCAGDMVTFTATGGTNYVFKVNGSSVQAGPSNTYSSSTLNNGNPVTVDVTNTDGCTATSAAIVMMVNSLPAGTLSASATTICAGDNVTFTATAGAATYDFRVNGTTIQNTASNIFITNLLTNGQVVTVIAKNATNCSKTFNAISITVNPVPAGTLTVTENSGITNDNSICAGTPVTFAFTAGFSNYNFKVNGMSKQSGPSNTYINSALVTSDVVTVEVSNSSGCKTTFTAPVITILAAPSGTLTVSPSATICETDNVVFTATSGFTSYNFKVTGNPVQNGAGNTYTTNSIANSDVVTVDVTNSDGCSAVFNSVMMTVTPLPTGTLVPVENSGVTPNDGTICLGDNIVFTAPTGFSNYDFILNGATIQSGSSNTYSSNSLVTGNQVTVAVTNGTGCIGLLNTITVTADPLPVVAPITGTLSVCISNTTALSNATAGGVWNSLNTAIATVDAAGAVTGVTDGTATINYTFTNTNGCTATVSAAVTVNAPPIVAPVTGNFNVCTSTDSQLADVTPGGTWNSSNTGVATVDATGLVTGVVAGNSTISYTVTDGNGCTTAITAVVTVTTLPTVAPITTTAPSFDVCIGGTIPLKDATTGGTWSSSNTAVATVNASGVVTGVTGGTADISYTITTTCSETVSATATITVNTPPSAAISYAGGPFCTTAAPVAVTQTGTAGGTYSSASGLTINGTDGTITPATSTGGTYTVTYTVAASNGCSLYITTTTVTITTAPAATIAYTGSPFCTTSGPVTVNRTGTAGGSYSSAAGLTINPGTGAITPATSTAGTYIVTYTILASGGCMQFTTQTSVTITAAPSATISYAGSPFCTNSATVNVTLTGTTGGTYSSAAGLSLDGPTGTVTPGTSTAGVYTVTYTIMGSGGCAIYTTTASITITAAPTSTAGGPMSTCSNSGPINITAGSSAANQASVVWSSSGAAGTITNANSLTTATYTPGAADIAAGSVILTLTANGSGSCPAAISSKTITISGSTSIVSVQASPAAICLGNSSNLFIPDATSLLISENFEGTSTFTVTNTATVGTEWMLKNSPYDYGGTTFNSGSHFMLTNSDKGSNGTYPTNTTLVSPTISTVGYSALNFQYKTYYRRSSLAEVAVVEVSTDNGASWTTVQNLTPGGSIPAAANFSTQNINLSSYVNNASFKIRFRFTVDNQWYWAVDDISLTGTIPTGNYSWTASPAATAGLPAGSATPSPANANIVVAPTVTGPTIYTATLTNGLGCTSTKDVTVTVNPIPTVTITADYCTVAGFVKLTANATPGVTFLWSTGETTQSINVDVADDYQVTVTLGNGCPASAVISVAQELSLNGDFTSGNTGFASDYAYKADIPAVTNELLDDTGNNGYSISNDGQNVQVNFWGKDHTNNATGPRNFMLVNGHGSALVVWKQTINVLPGTTYYFSAWAMSLNSVGPFSKLQFNVDGVLLGFTAVLTAGQNNNNNNGWVRFYGNWTSGPTQTVANISINDIQGSAIGNDFGLDDISFGTLSTFVQLESAPGTDAQTICANAPLTNIVYSVGSTASSPTITGLPAGLTTSFNGELFTISGTPTTPGSYTYTVTTTGTCNPSSASGTIVVQGQTISLSAGSSSPSACVNAALSIAFTLGGTATGATVTGLPPGVTSSTSGNTFTISGTPATEGVYPYTVTTTGPSCMPATTTGTITVQAQTITPNPSNASQTVCVNTPVTNIQFTVGGTATGASVTGLPPGVTGSYNSGFFIVSGTPSATGTFNYTITTSGPSCIPVQATGSIEVTSGATLTLTSGAATNPQTSCKNAPITDVTYAVNNATGAGVTGLPAGVSGIYNAGVFTISGTPTAGGIFNYTITTTGGCGSATIAGILTIQEQTVTLTSGVANPSLCASTTLPNIVYTWGGTATTATLTGVPIGTIGSFSGNTLTIAGTPADAAGPYNYTVTTSGTCAPATATGIITLTPAPVGGTLTSLSLCGGSSGNINLSGQSGNILNWQISTDGGATWSVIPNTTITQSYTNITQATMYRVAVGRSGCNIAYSTVATLNVRSVWTGITSSDWNTGSNWSDGLVPTTSCPTVTIPKVTSPNVYPILSYGIATINSLVINANASATISATGILQVAGSITNNGTFDAGDGTVEFNGTSPQTIAAGTFMNNAIKDLVISNSTGAGVILGGTLDVYHSLTYGAAGTQFATNDNLTLKSNASGTAWLGDMTGHTITGNVTVERYIPARKAWRFLSVPTQPGQTIHAAWQENKAANSLAPIGLGVQITSDRPTWSADGFDLFSAFGPSMKTYNPGPDNYTGVSSTLAPFSPGLGGYMIFIRGDRTANAVNSPVTSTVLRTKGILNTGPQTPLTIVAGQITPYMNPYAAPLDIRKIAMSNSVFFYVWDPNRGGFNGFGAFQTLSWNGTTYDVIPGSGSYGPGDITNFIESGQAFLVGGGAAVLPLNESKKGIGSGLTVFRPAGVKEEQQLRSTLYSVNADGSTLLADGVLSIFDDTYSNNVDGMDARKLANFGENLSIKTSGKLLVIERKQTVTPEDTIFLNLAGVSIRQYRFQFDPTNIKSGMEGFLEDNYLHTRTPVSLSGRTDVNFSIENVAGSYAADRFRIVFAPSAVLPVTFTSIKAYRQDKNINVEWRVENEKNIKQYEVEKSVNGILFTALEVVAATANNGNSASYQSIDTRPVEGYNYYRVKSVDINGSAAYTNVVKVMAGSLKHDITIYPNPITDGMLHLQFMNQPEGLYGIRLLNKVGQLIVSKQIRHAGGSSTGLIKWDFNLAHGMYQLEITKPGGDVKNINVLY